MPLGGSDKRAWPWPRSWPCVRDCAGPRTVRWSGCDPRSSVLRPWNSMVHTLVATSDFRDDRDDIRADGEDGALGLGVAASRARAFRHARLAGRGPRSMPRSPTGSRSKSTLRPRARLCPRVPQAACGLKSNAVPLCDLDMPFHVCTSTRAPRSPRPDPGRAVPSNEARGRAPPGTTKP